MIVNFELFQICPESAVEKSGAAPFIVDSCCRVSIDLCLFGHMFATHPSYSNNCMAGVTADVADLI